MIISTMFPWRYNIHLFMISSWSHCVTMWPYKLCVEFDVLATSVLYIYGQYNAYSRLCYSMCCSVAIQQLTTDWVRMGKRSTVHSSVVQYCATQTHPHTRFVLITLKRKGYIVWTADASWLDGVTIKSCASFNLNQTWH